MQRHRWECDNMNTHAEGSHIDFLVFDVGGEQTRDVHVNVLSE
jgi:hypothetical protein